LTIVERPRPAMSTCSVKMVPGCSRVEPLDPSGEFDSEARGTKLFHWGQVEVSRRASRIGGAGALTVTVARTVKAAPD